MLEIEEITSNHLLIEFQPFCDRITVILNLTNVDWCLKRKQGILWQFPPLDAFTNPLNVSLAWISF